MQSRPVAPESIRLVKGQSFRFYAAAGTRVIVMRGRIDVTESLMWLGPPCLEHACMVHEGEQYQVLQRGWIGLKAPGPAEFLCLEPEAGSSIAGALRGWLTGTAQFARTGMLFCLADTGGIKACIALFKRLKRTRAFMLKRLCLRR